MKRREPLNPDITPLIDVVFILLVFFIVTSTFKKDELALVLTLPSAEAQKIEIEPKSISIEITKERYAFAGREISFEQIQQKLSLVKDKKSSMIVRIDKKVTYDKIVKILDELQKNNLTNLSLVTSSKKQPK